MEEQKLCPQCGELYFHMVQIGSTLYMRCVNEESGATCNFKIRIGESACLTQ